MSTVQVEYIDGTKETITPTFDQWQELWRSGVWEGKSVSVLTHDGWPIKFREPKVELKKV